MRAVTKIQTRDGCLHETEEMARRHADAKYGEALTRLAHQIVRLEKYNAVVDFLEANHPAFRELEALRVDLFMEEEGAQ